MFNPGETITHTFTIPFAASELTTNAAKIYVTYKQQDDIFLERLITSGWQTGEENTSIIEVTFTQRESLLFHDRDKFEIQLNVYMDGARFVSELIRSNTGIQLKREVIS